MSEEDRDAVRTFGDDGQPQRGAWEALDSGAFARDAEKATTSQQHDTDDPHSQIDWYEPPYSPTNLALLLERSETHAAAVLAKSKNVAGFGFEVVPHDQADSDDPPGRSDVEEFYFGEDSRFQLGPDQQPATPAEVYEQAWTDYESVGWLAIEVLANDAGLPTGLAHVPAHTVRKRIDAPGWVQIDPDTEQIEGYFGAAGDRYDDEDPTFIDAETGEVGDSAGDVGTVANELLVIRNYSALAPHYGTPDIIPAIQTLFGDLAAREYNSRFFENDAVPRFAVIVEGGELTDKAWTELEEKFKELQLDENSHRGVILEAVSGAVGSIEDAHNVSLRIEPLTVGVEEDASFIEYRQENEHDLLKAHSVPPVVANRTEKINRANADAQRREFAQSTIRPKQETLASRVHATIHQTMLGVDGWTIDFVLHGAENEKRQAEIDKLRIEGTAGVLTVDEAREQVGLDPLDAPEGNMLVAEVSNQAGGAGSSGGSSPAGGEAEAARRSQRATDLGYSITGRAESDD